VLISAQLADVWVTKRERTSRAKMEAKNLGANKVEDRVNSVQTAPRGGAEYRSWSQDKERKRENGEQVKWEGGG